MNGNENSDSASKRAIAVFIVVVLAVLSMAVWAGTFLGKSQAANQSEELSANVTATQEQFAQLQSTSAGLRNDNDALLTQLAAALQSNAELQVQLAAAQQNIAVLQAQLAAAQQSIATLQAQLATAQQNIDTLKTQLASAQQSNTALQAQLTAAQQNAALLQTQLTSAQQNINSLQAQLASWYSWARSAPSTPALTLNSTSGPGGASITISGTGFAPNASGNVIFDINRNSIADPGEPLQNVTTSATGTFTTTLVVPMVAPGIYPILALSAGGSPQSSTPFTVTTGTG